MSEIVGALNQKIKNTSTSIGLIALRVISGGVLGLTIALIGEEIFSYQSFSFIFVLLTVLGGFMKLTTGWKYTGVIVFDLFCILLGMLLRLYIIAAPGQ